MNAVYLASAVTALTCALLLFRGYAQSRTPLLLWSGLCFVALTVNNVLVYVDLVLVKDLNLLPLRDLASVAAVLVLLVGLIWEAR